MSAKRLPVFICRGWSAPNSEWLAVAFWLMLVIGIDLKFAVGALATPVLVSGRTGALKTKMEPIN